VQGNTASDLSTVEASNSRYLMHIQLAGCGIQPFRQANLADFKYECAVAIQRESLEGTVRSWIAQSASSSRENLR
jgi:hypothetical protein